MMPVMTVFINFFLFILCSTLSVVVFFTFRIHLLGELNFSIIFSFICFQIMIWSPIVFKKKMLILTNSLFFLIFVNLLTTPLNYLLTKDLPYNPPNTEYIKDYKDADHFKGIFFGKHKISFDHMTYRTNKKKINYNIKKNNTLRIFTIGGSTTVQVTLDDKKTWSSLIGDRLENNFEKNIEVINTGVLGFASPYHFLTLKRIEKFNPDLIIFLVGVNDWNSHIVKSKNHYIFTNFEINYNVKNSILYKSFKNIKKQIIRKISIIINYKNSLNKDSLNNNNPPSIFFTDEKLWFENREYLSQIGSLNSKKTIRRFQPQNVSQNYNFWITKIVKSCKKNKYICIFMDQPNAYKTNISDELKSRLWMIPPFQNYTLPFDDLISISGFYNEWLRKKITDNNLNFLSLSSKIPPNLNYLFDDVHFTENGSKMVSDILFNYIINNIDINKF